jgi:hypothetical protein
VVDAAIIRANVRVVARRIVVAGHAVRKRSANATVIHARGIRTGLGDAFIERPAAIRHGDSAAFSIGAKVIVRAQVVVVTGGRVRRVGARAGAAEIVGARVAVIAVGIRAATHGLPCADTDPAGTCVVDRARVAVVAGDGRTGTAAANAAVA